MSAPAAAPERDSLHRLVRSGEEQLFERLQNLRAILPVFATELANARREAAQLRVENRKLKQQLARLHDERRAGSLTAARKQLKARLEAHRPARADAGKPALIHRPRPGV